MSSLPIINLYKGPLDGDKVTTHVALPGDAIHCYVPYRYRADPPLKGVREIAVYVVTPKGDEAVYERTERTSLEKLFPGL